MQSSVIAVSGPSLLYSTGAGGASPAGAFALVNLDTAVTLWIGNTANVSPSNGVPVPPLGSVQLDGSQPVYGTAASQVNVALIPGGTGYTPGELAISGPVTADISGPVTLASGTSVGITGAPAVTLSGSPSVNITGTPNINVTNAALTTVGAGGYILPGQIQGIASVSGTIPPLGGQLGVLPVTSVTPYASLDIAVNNGTAPVSAGSPYGVTCLITFTDSSGNDIIGHYSVFTIPGWNSFSVPCLGPYAQIYLMNGGTTGSGVWPVTGAYVWGSYRNITGPRWNSIYGPNSPVSDSNITWTGTSTGGSPGWLNSGGYSPGTGLHGVLMGPVNSGQVEGYFQVTGAAFSNNPVVIDMALQIRGSITAGTGNLGVVQSIPSALGGTPTSFTQIFPMSYFALILNAPSSSSNLQYTAVQEV